MQKEIDSSNIIAALVKGKDADYITLSYNQIYDVAIHLESMIPTLLTTYDLLSIDAFRCSFNHNVIMEEHQLVINNFKEIKYRLNKLLPPEKITELIIEFSKEENFID
ncbi:MAG TPA: hypothetical protein OIM39_04790 [Bacteroidaceae bacterium]|nr:hypothetical protein [Bacteroidaceae bacterium]